MSRTSSQLLRAAANWHARSSLPSLLLLAAEDVPRKQVRPRLCSLRGGAPGSWGAAHCLAGALPARVCVCPPGRKEEERREEEVRVHEADEHQRAQELPEAREEDDRREEEARARAGGGERPRENRDANRGERRVHTLRAAASRLCVRMR
eukprot:CAMPEP_0119355710 /NCGR_PEP_ID=MMETSP1334-20130426/4508_1 /TAXON_ID=127549 /ORGANISM="Calcidiscus leptoporus, Strain RCC1130" /LENGTH=149 /DNA_ID=CAMNT_0007369605 /DNA_START=339 /DNA_END=786 /DNA_ORIENTATION=+